MASKKITSLDELFLHTLQDIYFAEHAIVKALPKMVREVKTAELKEGFEAHLQETKGQILRLDEIFHALGKKPEATECPAIEGIIEEANELAGEISAGPVKDAALAAAAQAVEHYEISRYGTLIALARQLGHKEFVSPLEATLAEEKSTDSKLTKISASAIFAKAA